MFALKSNFSKAGHSWRISDVEAFEPRVHGLPDHPRGGQEPLCLSDGPIPSSIKWDQNMLKRSDRNKDENKRHPKVRIRIEGGFFQNCRL